jgi:hypothetical protein
MKLLLSPLSIESSSRSEEGRGGQQISPEFFEQRFFNEIHIVHNIIILPKCQEG